MNSKLLEIWARGVDRHPCKELDEDSDYRRVDESMPLCPRCHKHPRAWVSIKGDVGVVRCCGFGMVTVSGISGEPVSENTLVMCFTRQMMMEGGAR
jgi:hypothetical protein